MCQLEQLILRRTDGRAGQLAMVVGRQAGDLVGNFIPLVRPEAGIFTGTGAGMERSKLHVGHEGDEVGLEVNRGLSIPQAQLKLLHRIKIELVS